MAMRGFEPSVPLNLCTDCVCMIAHGECGDCHNERGHECPTGKRLARKWGDVGITLGCPEDCCERDADGFAEPWFSWSSCDGCGSSLGGDREHGIAWLPIRPVLSKTDRITVRESPEWDWREARLTIGDQTTWFSGAGRYFRMAAWKRERSA